MEPAEDLLDRASRSLRGGNYQIGVYIPDTDCITSCDDATKANYAIKLATRRGGANVAISGRLAARVGGEYLRMMPGDEGPVVSEALHGFRLSAGLVYGFGS